MRTLILALLWTVAGVIPAVAGTTLRFQDLPLDWSIIKRVSEAEMLAATCATYPTRVCLYFNTDDDHVYASTGTAAAQVWRVGGGHDIEDEGVGVDRRDIMNFTGPGISVSNVGDKTQVLISTEGAVDVLRGTSTRIPSTTVSLNEWTYVPESSATLVMDAPEFLRIRFNTNIRCPDYTRCGVAFSFKVNDAFVDGGSASTASGIKYVETDSAAAGAVSSLNIDHQTSVKVAGGVNEISLVWASVDAVPVTLGYNMLGSSLKYEQDPRVRFYGTHGSIVNKEDFGGRTNTEIFNMTCPDYPTKVCIVMSTDIPFDIFYATNTAGWRGVISGLGPQP